MSEEQKNVPEEDLTEMPETSSQEPATKEEIPVIQKLKETENSKKEIGTMEVHHHGHVHEKKKWKEYVFQFLMLFLAITAGFFVENTREHIIERQRSKQYAIALIEDLKKDSVELEGSLKANKFILTCFDSVRQVVKNLDNSNMVPGSFYYYSRIGTLSDNVVWHNAALTQIIQSGNLRYFSPPIVKYISIYYDEAGYTTANNENDKRYRDKTLDLRSRILNAFYFSKYSHYGMNDSIPDSLIVCKLPLQNNDPNALNEYVNSFENRRGSISIIIKHNLPLALKNAKELLLMLKKEYNLE